MPLGSVCNNFSHKYDPVSLGHKHRMSVRYDSLSLDLYQNNLSPRHLTGTKFRDPHYTTVT